MTVSDDELRDLVHRSCLFLDDSDWDAYLGLCTEDFTYRITAFSPELRKNMVWLEQDCAGMTNLFENLENHVTLKGRFLRHVNVALIECDEEHGVGRAISTFFVIHTGLDGVSTMFAVGRYNDTIDISGNRPLLHTREVTLDTRDLGGGTHFPI
jgi:methanesulfonate monooxygenase small subunit